MVIKEESVTEKLFRDGVVDQVEAGHLESFRFIPIDYDPVIPGILRVHGQQQFTAIFHDNFSPLKSSSLLVALN